MSAACRAALWVAVVALACGTVVAQQVGGIRGAVIDRDFSTPLSGVRVTVLGTQWVTQTSPDGLFAFDRIVPGSYSVVFAKEGYERQVLAGIGVRAGQFAELRVEMSAEVFEMEELVVTGSDFLGDTEIGMLEIRADSAVLQDNISSELISKAGASDAAGALKLVVGASVTAGKYATVRGLSDRYTGTTLNGVRLPSADPRRRAVQVDLFPTGTVESVTVLKTFTPDLQGDFTGGGVDIRTKSIPEGPVLSVSLSAEYNSIATGNDDFVTYEGGGVGAFGYESGSRELPSEAREPLPGVPNFSFAPTAEEIAASQAYDRVVRAFTPVMGTTREAVGPNYGFSVVGGNRYPLGERVLLGLLGAVTSSHKYDLYLDGQNDQGGVSVATDPITVTRKRTDSRGTDEVLLGALGSAALEIGPHHRLSLVAIVNHGAEDEARYQERDLGAPTIEQNQSLQYTERDLTSLQLRGGHTFEDAIPGTTFGNVVFDWTLAQNATSQDQPDSRYFRNVYDQSTFSGIRPSNTTDAGVTRRIWREVAEDNGVLSMAATLPFVQWTESEGYLRGGLFAERTDREYRQQSYTYSFASQFGSFLDPKVQENNAKSRFLGEDPEQLWTDVFLDPDRIGLATNSPPAPNQLLWYVAPLGDDVNYDGEQSIDAAFVMAELPVTPTVRLTGGARYETTDLAVAPFNVVRGTVEIIEILESGDRAIVTVPQEEAATDIAESSLLPALAVTWEMRPGMNLRGSWSKTLARPTFRELAPIATAEFLDGDEFLGTPDLGLSSIQNYDVRWEWFPRIGDVLAASVFHKDLTDPIEYISFGASNRAFIQPVNYPGGRVRGFELEGRTTLETLWEPLAGLGVGANYTYLDSEVEVPESEQESLAAYDLDEPTRQLQGQPSYIANLSLTYDRESWGTSFGLFFNQVGETLVTGAARGSEDGTPDVFELAYGTFDLTAKKDFKKGFAVTFRARNLLAPDRESVYRRPNGEEVVKSRRDTARTFSVGASWKW